MADNRALFMMTVQWVMQEMERQIQAENRIRQLRLSRIKRRLKVITLCLMKHREKHLRGAYCILPSLNREILEIFNGDPVLTRKHIRITPEALNLFCSKLDNTKTHGWSKKFEAIVFLYWLATGTCFRVVAISFNIARSTSHMICRRMLEETVALTQDIIRLPVGDEVAIVGEGFGNLAGSPVFKNAVGAIDGCQIRTLAPSGLHDQYINRKLFYSIMLQGLVDHRGFFIDICAGFPGSVHDMRVLRHSNLWRSGTYPPEDYFILCDGGYQTRLHPICMVAPYRAPLTREQANFNHHLSKGRCVVECAFGSMQCRWRSIFTKALEVKLKTGVQVIGACAVLHNICITAGDVLRLEPGNLVPRAQPVREEVEGGWFRDLLLNLHTAYQRQQNGV